jgi:hypothetical protein
MTIRENWERAASFAKAMVTTAIEGCVDQATFTTRMDSCRSCDSRQTVEGRDYCGACNCGMWSLAALDKKLWFAGLDCPKGRKGFANEGKACASCHGNERATTALAPGDAVIITATLDGDAPDMTPWKVTAVAGDLIDIERPRRWWSPRRWTRGPERATVARKALHRVVDKV